VFVLRPISTCESRDAAAQVPHGGSASASRCTGLATCRAGAIARVHRVRIISSWFRGEALECRGVAPEGTDSLRVRSVSRFPSKVAGALPVELVGAIPTSLRALESSQRIASPTSRPERIVVRVFQFPNPHSAPRGGTRLAGLRPVDSISLRRPAVFIRCDFQQEGQPPGEPRQSRRAWS
jgi:hypothetical protein